MIVVSGHVFRKPFGRAREFHQSLTQGRCRPAFGADAGDVSGQRVAAGEAKTPAVAMPLAEEMAEPDEGGYAAHAHEVQPK